MDSFLSGVCKERVTLCSGFSGVNALSGLLGQSHNPLGRAHNYESEACSYSVLYLTYDSLVTEYTLKDVTFETFARTYEKQTEHPFEEKLLSSFSLVTEDGFLTNAGVLFSDQCPYRHSSLYCTRWTGLHKDDAKDSREYQGNLLKLLNAGEQFIDLHNLKGWIKLPNRRLNTPDYSKRAIFEALVNAFYSP